MRGARETEAGSLCAGQAGPGLSRPLSLAVRRPSVVFSSDIVLQAEQLRIPVAQ